jgi:hypothetical protein
MNAPCCNPKFALVIADAPKSIYGNTTWINFSTKADTIAEKQKCLEKTAENVWLITLENGLLALGQIVEAADTAGCAIRVLFFADKPNWIKYPPDAETPAVPK